LPSACELPIIVVVKIKLRIGAEHGNAQGKVQHSEQSLRQQDRTVHPPSPWSPRSHVSSATSPTKNPADGFLRRGAARCARFTVADQRPSLAAARSTPAVLPWLRFLPQPAGQQTASATIQPSKTVQVPDISNRNWLKNRSGRKQKTKPCLTGARIAQCHARFLRDSSVNFLPAEPNRGRPPVAWSAIEL
jgi:hypothetical protein